MPYRELAGVLNQLAGTVGLEAQGAANVWAGTAGNLPGSGQTSTVGPYLSVPSGSTKVGSFVSLVPSGSVAPTEVTSQRANAFTEANGTTRSATYPATPTQGDLLFASFITRTNASTHNTPSGWTLLETAISNTIRGSLYYKIAGASEPTTVTFTNNSPAYTMVTLLEFTGVSTTSPIDIYGNKAAVSADTTVNCLPALPTTLSSDVNRLGLVIMQGSNRPASITYTLAPQATNATVGYAVSTTLGYNYFTISKVNLTGTPGSNVGGNLELVHALNVKAGITAPPFLEFAGACNVIAGTTNLGGLHALNVKAGNTLP